MTKFVSNREIYEQVIRDRVPLAKKRLWIATADIKDMYVDSGGRDMVPFLKVLATLIGKGVEIRLTMRRSRDRTSERTSTAIRASSRRWNASCVPASISSA